MFELLSLKPQVGNSLSAYVALGILQTLFNHLL